LKYPNLPGNDFDAMIQPGVLDDYDRDEIMKMDAALVYHARRYWKCPICDHVVDREDPLWIEKAHDHCQLKEHYGAECIAHRQETKARELLAAKRLKARAS
jgi:tRNA G26 N,N-dimethylase Trm1